MQKPGLWLDISGVDSENWGEGSAGGSEGERVVLVVKGVNVDGYDGLAVDGCGTRGVARGCVVGLNEVHALAAGLRGLGCCWLIQTMIMAAVAPAQCLAAWCCPDRLCQRC